MASVCANCWENKVIHFISRLNTREGTPKNGLYGEAPPESGTFFRLQVYEIKRVGVLLFEVYTKG